MSPTGRSAEVTRRGRRPAREGGTGRSSGVALTHRTERKALLRNAELSWLGIPDRGRVRGSPHDPA